MISSWLWRALQVISDSVLARLFTFPNVVVTGHQAFFTIDALDNIAQTTIKNVATFVEEGKTGEQHPNNVKAEYS
jgi:D-lactate dehydrogenase